MSKNKIDKMLKKEFNKQYKLSKGQYIMVAVAGVTGSLTDLLTSGANRRNRASEGKINNKVRDTFKTIIPESSRARFERLSKVPFDAVNVQGVKGLDAKHHRLNTFGHDPILGFIIGVRDIMTGRCTSVNNSFAVGGFDNGVNIVEAIIKEFYHLLSDINTPMGLPAPFMCLAQYFKKPTCVLNNKSIAQIVDEMYIQGFDFIHFLSQSITTMLTSLIIRIGYIVDGLINGRKLKEVVKEAIVPFDEHNKIDTMFFMAHSIVVSENCVKVIACKDKTCINLAEVYSYLSKVTREVKWSFYDKRKQFKEYKEDNYSKYNGFALVPAC